jgi:O-antigen ligase
MKFRRRHLPKLSHRPARFLRCLLFTLARGAWLGITLGILLLVLLLAYRWQRRKLVLVSVIILIAGGVMFFMLNIGLASSSSTSFEWLSTSRIMEARAISNNERLVLWRQTLPIVASRPWLGYGPETFSSAFWRTYPDGTETILRSIDPWDPHNWFLYHLIGTGVLGFLVFVWLQVRFFFVTIASFQRFESIEMQIISAAVVGAGAAYLIQTQFNPIAIAPAAIYWLVFAMGAVLGSDRISPPRA